MNTIILFIFATMVIYFASYLHSKILMGIGICLVGITDCSSVSILLTIAGRWKKSGISAYNLSQCSLVFLNSCYMAFTVG